MKFFLDENLPLSIADLIRKLGFEVEHAIAVGLKGASDKQIAEFARKRKAILVTKDVEFSSSIIYPKGTHYGLLILRLPHQWITEKIAETLKEFLTKIEVKKLVDAVTILEVGRYRIRNFR